MANPFFSSKSKRRTTLHYHISPGKRWGQTASSAGKERPFGRTGQSFPRLRGHRSNPFLFETTETNKFLFPRCIRRAWRGQLPATTHPSSRATSASAWRMRFQCEPRQNTRPHSLQRQKSSNAETVPGCNRPATSGFDTDSRTSLHSRQREVFSPTRSSE